MRRAGMRRAGMLGLVIVPLLMALPALAQKNAPVVVKMKTAQGQDAGTVTLAKGHGGVAIKVALTGLPPGEHGMHFHQNAKCDGPDFKSAGAHFNPDNKQHGTKNPSGPHAGDLPFNLQVKPDGTDHAQYQTNSILLDTKAANSVFANGGTSIVIHEKADDMMTDPSGNSGARIACGVVEAPMKRM